MPRRAEKWNGDPANAIKISGKGISRKAKQIENSDDFHIGASVFKGRTAVRIQHQPHKGACADIHYGRHNESHAKHQE